METKDFVQQLNYPTRKIDGNFILDNKVSDVQAYIDEAELNRQICSEERTHIINSNREKTEKLLAYLLDEVGVDQWKIFKKKKRGRGWSATTIRGDMYAHYRKVFEDVEQYVPRPLPKIADYGTSNCQYELAYNNTTLTVRFSAPHTLQDIFDKSIQEIKRYEYAVAKENKHLIVAKEYLDKKGEDYSELITAKDIIELAEEMSKEEYRESVFAGGETITVQHSDGDDCEWDGGHRCECSFNRYYLEIEGNMIDGYYSWGQWC